MSMVKLIESCSLDPAIGAGAELVFRQGEMSKQASTIFGMDYSDMKPDDRHVGIHVVALGDSDHYLFNRNADAFPKEACAKYHDTFVKHGHVFRHHRNKDPEKAIGIVKASAYNEPMGRVELFIHADKDKAAPELARLEKEGEIPFSMACLVDHDRCFTKGALVLTDQGFKPIETVSVGDFVVTAEASTRRVIATSVHHASRLARVSVRGLPEELECTDDHPFNVVSESQLRSCRGSTNNKKRRHTPKDGSEKCGTCGKTIDFSSTWKPAKDLVEGDYIKVRFDSCSQDITRGIAFAYLCGMYVGDGSATWEVSGRDKKGDTSRITGLSISASLADNDRCIIDRIIESYRLCTGKEATVTAESHDRKAVAIHLDDVLFANKVVSLTGMYCREKFVGGEILGWSKAEKEAVLGGFLDADGNVGYRGGRPIMRICSVNKGLLLSVQRLFWSVGIPATVGIGNSLENMRSSEGFVHKSSSYHVFFSKATASLSAASEKLKRSLAFDKIGRGGSGILLVKGYAYLPVSSVRVFDSEPVAVYNFEVEDSHTYVVEGAAVHNCSICGSLRKSAGDASECDHVANHLGELWDDGRQVGTYNDTPKFFDISFVGKPADRIAWNLTKAASSGFVDSVKLAEYEGVVPPDDLAVEPGAATRKLGYARGIAEMQSMYTGWLSKKASVLTTRDRYLRGFTKVSASSIDEDTVGRMREVPVRDMLSKLASCGVMMDVPTFFRYAMGPEMYGKHVAPVVHDVEDAVPRVLASRVKSASMSSICNDATYDAYRDLSLARVPERVSGMLSKVASTMADPRAAVLDASMTGVEPKYLDMHHDKCLNGGVVEKLAEAYLSYQLSAIDAVVNGRRSRGADDGALELEALAAAGNLQAR